jgi:SAM-dependent methyltransferase
MRRAPPEAAEFDRQHGVDTAGIVHLARHELAGGNRDFAASYQAVRERRFRELVFTLPIAYDEFTFVDLGCGKGRPLVLAAQLPFRRIIGVEFSRQLHDVAATNVARLRANGVLPALERIELVWLDAAQFEFPAEPLVVHFFNPFFGSVLTQVLQNLRSSVERAPREVLLCFTGAVPAEVAEGDGFSPVGAEGKQTFRVGPG